MMSRLLHIATIAAVALQAAVGATFFGALAMITLTSFSVLPQPF